MITSKKAFCRTFLILTFIFSGLSVARAQDQHHTRKLPIDTAITTTHTVRVNGQEIPYSATAGTQPVYGEDGKPIASLFYVYYQRTDVEDKERRPIFISFNGGPGAGSLWMHMGYTSPKRVMIDDEGFPVQPYGVTDNHHSIIDVADIVYVNPVNVGFSRIISDTVKREVFFGVNEDIEYLADWISNFISRHNRWRSPKYLIGESYGTPRVSGLAGELQNRHWMFFNGVILVSPTELGISREGPVEAALPLPYFTAAAWYHQELPPELQKQDLEQILPEVEAFTLEEYIPALTHGGFIKEQRKKEIAEKVAYYSGISVQDVLNYNLKVPKWFFWKDLLREEGYTIGRLDSRYKGIDKRNAGVSFDYAPEYSSWKHSFTPAINYYLREELGFETDLEYMVSGDVHPWNRDNNHTGESLRQAMAQNPYLHVMIQSGYYDGACDYFSAKYTMWHIDPSGKMQDRFRYETYRSGHMMYLRKEDLKTATDDIREFIEATIPEEGVPARYDYSN
ncbi:MAG TPA: carboxypeptidase [Balneolaceae bacterium]|nr:carboxypeptidase [Balneolaceae bacterium]